jgi:hypothetical protein
MSRKDFELIADVVSTIASDDLRRAVAHRFCDKLSATNPRFNTSTFLGACGVRA